MKTSSTLRDEERKELRLVNPAPELVNGFQYKEAEKRLEQPYHCQEDTRAKSHNATDINEDHQTTLVIITRRITIGRWWNNLSVSFRSPQTHK
jgi:hypothetical protein